MNEEKIAAMEAYRDGIEDDYFKARPWADSSRHNRKLFDAGFQRAWEFQQNRIDDLEKRLNSALRENGYEPT